PRCRAPVGEGASRVIRIGHVVGREGGKSKFAACGFAHDLSAPASDRARRARQDYLIVSFSRLAFSAFKRYSSAPCFCHFCSSYWPLRLPLSWLTAPIPA